MKIAIPKERQPHERRVAASPETVKKLVQMGCEVFVEKEAGLAAYMLDRDYETAGAKIISDPQSLYKEANVILKVQKPLLKGEGEIDELALMKKGTVVVGILSAMTSPTHVSSYANAGITAIALEMVPRITRAQVMDVLSSQSNLAGYKAVLDAASEFGKIFPMMMTAAGTILPAKVLILGAGVAGLQAIATAKRLGAVVSAFDVRAATKEQVQSLGATFIEVENTGDAETSGGYAREMAEDYKRRQAELIHKTLKTMDIVISTALIPGKPAPVLITEEMVKEMKPGSVIVDLAVEAGGNCPLSEAGKIVEKHGVKIVGHANMPSRLASDASALYARNTFNFFKLIFNETTKKLSLNFEDEIINASVITHEGKILREDIRASQPSLSVGPKESLTNQESLGKVVASKNKAQKSSSSSKNLKEVKSAQKTATPKKKSEE
jgi:NAD(P) transhydrogenase subunit alpha